MNKNKFLIIGISLMLFLLTWKLYLTSEIKNPIQEFQLEMEMIGHDALSASVNAPLGEYEKTKDVLQVTLVSLNKNILELHGRYITKSIPDDVIIYDNSVYYLVDKNSRQLITENAYLFFPQNVQKIDYLLMHPLIEFPTVFEFVGEENLQGLDVYVFSCYAEKNDVTGSLPEFDSFALTMDQKCKIWIEPVTGTQVKFENNWQTFASYNDAEVLIEDGGTMTTQEFVEQAVNSASVKKQTYILLDVVVPLIILVLVGLSFFMYYKNRKN